ncbi:MAG: hypothetical protein OXD29_13415 [Roseovarius sp.]|nr:hypothetical protein [Roseovarius sp.]
MYANSRSIIGLLAGFFMAAGGGPDVSGAGRGRYGDGRRKGDVPDHREAE